MKSNAWLIAAAIVVPALGACSDDEGTGATNLGDGTGGSLSTGGKATATGGSSTAGRGGAGAGGASSTGGAPGTGGANADASAGGATHTGGSTATGGTANTGGANDGGAGAPDGAAGADGGDSGTPPGPAPLVTSLSTTGHDRLFGVTRDTAGNIYATGQISSSVDATADFSVMVVKFSATGSVDTTFGTSGVATKNVTVGGTSRELARGIVIQSTGKIVIAGNAEHDPTAAGEAAHDTDIVLLRFDSGGVLDSSFGNQGVVRLDLSTGVETTGTNGPTISGADQVWSLALAAGDKLVLHGSKRADDSLPDGGALRTDADWVLMRLTAEGQPDSTFSGDGKVTLDMAQGNAAARTAIVLDDGSIVAAGYTRTDVLGTVSQQPVLYKVTSTGDFDTTFATTDPIGSLPGVWHDYAAPDGAEAYGLVHVADKFVTVGYGPTAGSGTGTDWTCFRFSEAGDRDLSFGTSGATIIDVGGYADNGRGATALPDGRVMGFGGGRKAPPAPLPSGEQPEVDAVIAVLRTNGMPDTSFGANGFRIYDMGGTADHFWAGSVSPDEKQIAVVGIAGGETSADDDDAALLLLPLEP